MLTYRFPGFIMFFIDIFLEHITVTESLPPKGDLYESYRNERPYLRKLYQMPAQV